MKKIAFHINSLLAGGIEKVLLELLRALPRHKYDVRLLVTYEFGAAEVLRHEVPLDVPVIYLLPISPLTRTHIKKKTAKVTSFEKLLAEIFIVPFRKNRLRQRLEAEIADVDILVDFDMTLAPMFSSFSGKRSIAYCHFSLSHYFEGNGRKLAKLAKRLNHYNQVVMLCDEMKEEAAKRYPFLSEKLVRIYNAIDFEKITLLASEPLPDAAISFQKNGYIVSVGRLQETQKDFTTLIKAFAYCVAHYRISESLVIVGHGGSQQQLENLASELGIGERVFFAGFQQNPYPWLAASKLFVFSSKYEGLPTVLIEALALQKPIVATACPTGVRELLMQGNAGTLVPIGDVQVMGAAIYQLLTDPHLASSYKKCSASFLKEFSIRETIQQTEQVLFQ